MGVRTDFPRSVRRIDNAWIPLADGTRLAARIWLPDDAEADPVPAILEYLPYRKGDAMARRDARHHPYFAGHGYAAVRVDLRGTRRLRRHPPRRVHAPGGGRRARGPRVARRPALVHRRASACSASRGAGSTACRSPRAARRSSRPSSSMCASDDRYADDVHYIGGCVLALDMLPWAATMLTLLAQPPDPATVGDGWRDTWFARMERTPAFVEPWLAHQRRDDYWRHGSVCEDYARDPGPGLRDRRLGRRLHERDPAPARRPARPAQGPRSARGRTRSRRTASPARRSGSSRSACAGGTTGSRTPTPGSWTSRCCARGCRTRCAPAGSHAERPGRWVAEERWPSPEIEVAAWTWPRTASARRATPADAEPAETRSSITARRPPGRTPAHGAPTAARATSRRPARRGRPLADVHLAAARGARRDPRVPRGDARRRRRPARGRSSPSGCATSRPTARSLLVTRGLLNLTHRDEPRRADAARARPALHRRPSALDAIAQAIPAGHRLRRRDLDVVLAVGLALARAGHAHGLRGRGQPPGAAGARAARLRRRAARLRGAGVVRADGPGGAALRSDEPHPRPRPRGRRAGGPVPVGRRRPPAARRRRAGTRRHEPDELPDRRRRPAVGERAGRCESTLARDDWHTRSRPTAT